MEMSAQFAQVATALAAAQGEFPPIPRDRTVTVKPRPRKGQDGTTYQPPAYAYSYAPLETILEKTRPALSKNGLCLTQAIVTDANGTELLRTTLIHTSGEFMACDVPIFSGVGDNKSQAYASGVTYSRRYGVTLILCVAADEDDDGSAGDQEERDFVHVPPMERQRQQSPAQRARSGPERGGRIVDARKEGETGRQPYPAAAFATNLPKWEALVRSGNSTAEQLIATLQTRAEFTEEQLRKLRSLGQPAQQTPEEAE